MRRASDIRDAAGLLDAATVAGLEAEFDQVVRPLGWVDRLFYFDQCRMGPLLRFSDDFSPLADCFGSNYRIAADLATTGRVSSQTFGLGLYPRFLLNLLDCVAGRLGMSFGAVSA